MGHLGMWHYLKATVDVVSHGQTHLARSPPPPSTATYDHSSMGLSSTSAGSLTHRLPPNDIMVHLIQVVDHHLNDPLRLFCPKTLQNRLNTTSSSFQISCPDVATWQVQLLVTVALAKLFGEKDSAGTAPPGSREFFLAEKVLPCRFQLLQDPITAVETLSLLSWYAQAADLHDLVGIYVKHSQPQKYGLDVLLTDFGRFRSARRLELPIPRHSMLRQKQTQFSAMIAGCIFND